MPQSENSKYDVVIIGAGPAGLTASVYASRAGLSVIFIEKGAPGGKMVNTSKIENWSGDLLINGADLSLKMFEHAQEYSGKYKYGEIIKIESPSEFKHKVFLKSGEIIEAKSVIVASGMIERVPEKVENIHNFNNNGVSYCAICDGPIFAGTEMAVIGDGNSAIEEGAYLASVASKVYVFSILPKLTAEKRIIDELLSKKNVEVFYESQVLKLNGDKSLSSLVALVDGKERTFKVSALFPYIGFLPSTTFLTGLKITNKQGFVITDENMETSVKGIYAIGDVREKNIRQIVTAASDGSIAAKIITNKIG